MCCLTGACVGLLRGEVLAVAWCRSPTFFLAGEVTTITLHQLTFIDQPSIATTNRLCSGDFLSLSALVGNIQRILFVLNDHDDGGNMT
jgi:hypothetical protein